MDLSGLELALDAERAQIDSTLEEIASTARAMSAIDPVAPPLALQLHF